MKRIVVASVGSYIVTCPVSRLPLTILNSSHERLEAGSYLVGISGQSDPTHEFNHQLRLPSFLSSSFPSLCSISPFKGVPGRWHSPAIVSARRLSEGLS